MQVEAELEVLVKLELSAVRDKVAVADEGRNGLGLG